MINDDDLASALARNAERLGLGTAFKAVLHETASRLDPSADHGPTWPHGARCPAHKSGGCTGDHGVTDTSGEVLATCPTFKCERCRRWFPWCFGGDSNNCNDCDNALERVATAIADGNRVVRVSKRGPTLGLLKRQLR